MEVPELVDVALSYFWKHCPDPRAQAMAESDQDWERLIQEYDEWSLSDQ